jgi:hypothetical protein
VKRLSNKQGSLTRIVSMNDRRANEVAVDVVRMENSAIRLERDRPSDLPLIQICLMENLPEHVREARPGVFVAHLPADVHKTIWFVEGGFVVGTYATATEASRAAGTL